MCTCQHFKHTTYHSVNFVGGYIKTALTFESNFGRSEFTSVTRKWGLATTTSDGNVFPCSLLNDISRLSGRGLPSSVVRSTIAFGFILVPVVRPPSTLVSVGLTLAVTAPGCEMEIYVYFSTSLHCTRTIIL